MTPARPHREARVHVRVLGTLTVTGDEGPAAAPLVTQPRQLALLAYLLLARPRGLQARDSILPLLWPEHDEPRARQALRNALHGLRRSLGPDAFRTAGDHLVGVDHDAFTCDALQLEAGTSGTSPVPGAWLAAEPLAGFHVGRAPAFEDWLAGERERLRELQAMVRTSGTSSTLTAAMRHAGGALTLRSPHEHDAYAHYVRGTYMFLQAAHNGRFEDLDRSRECFERALEIDPAYALAIAGLSNYYAVAGARGILKPFETAFGRTLELSRQAIAIDPTLAIPHVHFGVKAFYLDDDLQEAAREFTLATTLDPHYAEGHRFLGIVLRLLGEQARGMQALEFATTLEPDAPSYTNSLGAALIENGDVARAEVMLRAALKGDPRFVATRDRLLRLLESQERLDDAVAVRLTEPAMPTAERFAAAFRADGAAGYRREREAELRAIIAQLEAKLVENAPLTAGDMSHPPVIRLAVAYAELGDWKKARAWKLQGCAARPGLATRFAAEPMLAPLYRKDG